MKLSPENLVVIGLVASVITQALRLLANHYGWKAPREVTNIALFVIAAGLAVAFFGLPQIGGSDPAEFVGAVLQAAAAVFGAAVLIYNVLLDKVLLPVEK